MSDYPMLISNKLHSFRNFYLQYSHFIKYLKYSFQSDGEITFFLTTL